MTTEITSKICAGRLTQIERARAVCEIVMQRSIMNGRWEELGTGASPNKGLGRMWTVDLGHGMSAIISDPTTRAPDIDAPFRFTTTADKTIDVFQTDVGKVLSLSMRQGSERLIGFTAGPWEKEFGLPEQSWSLAVAQRLERRAAAASEAAHPSSAI